LTLLLQGFAHKFQTILSNMLILPQPKHKPVYYHALITEVCKLSAATIGPAVGKSIRKLYGMLGEGLDVEIARRFSEWFAVHMSNFSYQWVWKEWFVVSRVRKQTRTDLPSGSLTFSWISITQNALLCGEH
jgi:MIF4G like